MRNFLNFLGLLLFLVLILINLFNLGLVIFTLFFVLVFIISDFLFGGLFSVKLDGETNKFGMLLDQLLDTFLFQVFRHIFLQVENDACTTVNTSIISLGDGEGTTSLRSPCVGIFFVVVFGSNLNLVSYEVSRVETNTKLSNHGNISTSAQRFHKLFGSRLGNGTQVVHQISLGHTNTSILNGQGVVGFVSDQFDLQLRLRVQDCRVSQRLVTDLIKSITSIGNQFSQENLLVGVKGVDDQRKKLVDISREGIAFSSFRGGNNFTHGCKFGFR
mmetsp:Transcript_14736/g.19260  ORF Transcript_14736/g.19260 Transcript_14736/m.19260 type:complete len:273 (+) Transcript_14736:1475-2293(+)